VKPEKKKKKKNSFCKGMCDNTEPLSLESANEECENTTTPAETQKYM